MTFPSYAEEFKTFPAKALKRLVLARSALEAMEQAAQEWSLANGDFKASGVSAKRVTKTFERLDTDKAEVILNEAGLDIMDVADVRLTEESIIAKLGKEKGNAIISELKQSGATKKFTTEYLKISVK